MKPDPKRIPALAATERDTAALLDKAEPILGDEAARPAALEALRVECDRITSQVVVWNAAAHRAKSTKARAVKAAKAVSALRDRIAAAMPMSRALANLHNLGTVEVGHGAIL